MVEISHIVNFLSCHGYRLCLVNLEDGCFTASFTETTYKVPEKKYGCGTYQAAIMTAAQRLFENNTPLAALWAKETLKCLYKDRG